MSVDPNNFSIPSAPAELRIGDAERDPWLDYVQPEPAEAPTPVATPASGAVSPVQPYAASQPAYLYPPPFGYQPTPQVITGRGVSITALALAGVAVLATLGCLIGASAVSSHDASGFVGLMFTLLSPIAAAAFALAVTGFSIGSRTYNPQVKMLGGIALGLALTCPALGVMTMVTAFG